MRLYALLLVPLTVSCGESRPPHERSRVEPQRTTKVSAPKHKQQQSPVKETSLPLPNAEAEAPELVAQPLRSLQEGDLCFVDYFPFQEIEAVVVMCWQSARPHPTFLSANPQPAPGFAGAFDNHLLATVPDSRPSVTITLHGTRATCVARTGSRVALWSAEYGTLEGFVAVLGATCASNGDYEVMSVGDSAEARVAPPRETAKRSGRGARVLTGAWNIPTRGLRRATSGTLVSVPGWSYVTGTEETAEDGSGNDEASFIALRHGAVSILLDWVEPDLRSLRIGNTTLLLVQHRGAGVSERELHVYELGDSALTRRVVRCEHGEAMYTSGGCGTLERPDVIALRPNGAATREQ